MNCADFIEIYAILEENLEKTFKFFKVFFHEKKKLVELVKKN